MMIRVNGKSMEIAGETSICDFLLSIRPGLEGMIVELNEGVIPRDVWSCTIISDGDCLEIVSLVGGG